MKRRTGFVAFDAIIPQDVRPSLAADHELTRVTVSESRGRM
jgi:hypothetical protein